VTLKGRVSLSRQVCSSILFATSSMDRLRQERQRQLQKWQDLGLPVVEKLLAEDRQPDRSYVGCVAMQPPDHESLQPSSLGLEGHEITDGRFVDSSAVIDHQQPTRRQVQPLRAPTGRYRHCRHGEQEPHAQLGGCPASPCPVTPAHSGPGPEREGRHPPDGQWSASQTAVEALGDPWSCSMSTPPPSSGRPISPPALEGPAGEVRRRRG
jgi:hypothetical protein